jgi:hypothetical protein
MLQEHVCHPEGQGFVFVEVFVLVQPRETVDQRRLVRGIHFVHICSILRE